MLNAPEKKPPEIDQVSGRGRIHFFSEKRKDRVFYATSLLSGLFIPFITIAIFCVLLYKSLPTWRAFGFHFLTSSEWDPVAGHFGAASPIWGTLLSSAVALIFAVPISFGVAIFLTEVAPRPLRGPLGVLIELLAAIPSIIYGMWGLFVMSPFLGHTIYPWLNDHVGPLPFIGVFFTGPPLGLGVLTAGLILSMMIVPFMSSMIRDVFLSVPSMIKESGFGLGATTWEVVRGILIPQTKLGILGATILGLGRALGETMAVTFVIGNSHELSMSLLMPGNTISSALANEFTEATGELYTSSLVALGLVLFLITTVVLAIAQVTIRRGASRRIRA